MLLASFETSQAGACWSELQIHEQCVSQSGVQLREFHQSVLAQQHAFISVMSIHTCTTIFAKLAQFFTREMFLFVNFVACVQSLWKCGICKFWSELCMVIFYHCTTSPRRFQKGSEDTSGLEEPGEWNTVSSFLLIPCQEFLRADSTNDEEVLGTKMCGESQCLKQWSLISLCSRDNRISIGNSVPKIQSLMANWEELQRKLFSKFGSSWQLQLLW